jgi:electron transport complex protein RnfC
MGGPMMGFTLQNTDIPVVKTTNCILAPTNKELPPPSPAQACIRCGLCAEACPVSLLPQQMYWFARGKEYEKLEAHNLMDCIECGACSYVCPSNIPLVQYYRASKAEIREQKQDAIRAEHSKARFEARQQRIERQEAEKEAKRKARKAAAEARAAQGAAGKGDAIQDAIERANAKKKSADPAQAAIEKAKTKRAGDEAETVNQESLEQALATVEKRLAAARQKLEQAEQAQSDKIDAFKLGVEKTQQKYQQAKTALDQFIANNPVAEQPTTDPAQLAIAKAKEKRANQAELSPREKAQHAVDSLNTRLQKAQQKLSEAQAENSDKLEIFSSTVQALQQKLIAAEAELSQFPAAAETITAAAVASIEVTATPATATRAPETNAPETSTSETKAPETKVTATGDAAQDAIARAIAKREAAASMSDEQRLKNALDSITTRLEKARQKLAKAEAENDDNTAIFAAAVTKLTVKLADASDAFENHQQQGLK